MASPRGCKLGDASFLAFLAFLAWHFARLGHAAPVDVALAGGGRRFEV
jgi:hypothetical protein